MPAVLGVGINTISCSTRQPCQHPDAAASCCLTVSCCLSVVCAVLCCAERSWLGLEGSNCVSQCECPLQSVSSPLLLNRSPPHQSLWGLRSAPHNTSARDSETLEHQTHTSLEASLLINITGSLTQTSLLLWMLVRTVPYWKCPVLKKSLQFRN